MIKVDYVGKTEGHHYLKEEIFLYLLLLAILIVGK